MDDLKICGLSLMSLIIAEADIHIWAQTFFYVMSGIGISLTVLKAIKDWNK